jgi:hypothetical protein
METQKDNNDYTRRNRFTGESIELTKEEAESTIKYFITRHSPLLMTRPRVTGASKHWDTMRKNLHWFRQYRMPKHTWSY